MRAGRMTAVPSVGRNTLRREGPEKVSGLARYTDDYRLPGALHGVTLRSTIPRGRIRAIRYDPAFPWSEYVIATARDIPGVNDVALIEHDQPLLADTEVRHGMEPILLLAHARRDRAYEALAHINVDYDALEPILTIDEALARKQIVRGVDNVFKEFVIERGDVRAGLAAADVVVEGEYRVPHQEQGYIEPNAMAAWWEPDGTLVVRGSLQCPYYVHKAMKPIFGLSDDRVRVIHATTGGAFGGKEEYPNMIAGHAALLALKARRPVKIIYDRHEDMVATTKRHPARIRHKTGITRDGRLVAQDIEIVMDGGAYATLSAVVLSRGTLHATGPYECPNVRVRGSVVATNTPPNGAFRGFGAPQTLFAAELHMERIAASLDIDPLALRRKNVLVEGSVMATGQVLRESVGARDVLEACVRRSAYARKARENTRWNKRKDVPAWRGIGLALVHHGAGFTGSGETFLKSRAAITLSRKGDIRVLAASTEMGQGTTTMFAQIAADSLGVPEEWVEVETPDTRTVPDSGPTVASRTCMIVGRLVQRAARELRDELVRARGGVPTTRAALAAAARQVCGQEGERRFEVAFETPPEIHWDDATYTGDAYGVYGYAAMTVELEVDKRTFEVAVRKVVTAQDVGKAIHPLHVEGQIVGGAAQGLGYALLENVVLKDGVMFNSQFTNYILPTSLDLPDIDVTIIEKAYSRGPFGAKGVGELPIDVPAPAVAAAIHQATGLWVTELPILPERILRAHRERERARG
jgi:CO/xanthine dehydrogenase Mo-binding subunit